MDNASKGKFGEEYVMKWLLKTKKFDKVIEAKNVNGCDLVAYRNGKRYLIEVKTTEKSKWGIPDMHDTEMSQKAGGWYFNADYLYLVRLGAGKKVKRIDIVTKKEINKFFKKHTTLIRIRTSALQTAMKNALVGTSEYPTNNSKL